MPIHKSTVTVISNTHNPAIERARVAGSDKPIMLSAPPHATYLGRVIGELWQMTDGSGGENLTYLVAPATALDEAATKRFGELLGRMLHEALAQ